jgi:hypothetical protein
VENPVACELDSDTIQSHDDDHHHHPNYAAAQTLAHNVTSSCLTYLLSCGGEVAGCTPVIPTVRSLSHLDRSESQGPVIDRVTTNNKHSKSTQSTPRPPLTEMEDLRATVTDAFKLQSTTFRLYSSAAAPVTGAAVPRHPASVPRHFVTL